MAKQVRTRVVAQDGAEFKIAPLTLDQIDEYVAPLGDIADQKKVGFKKGFQVVCFGLNNALPEGSADTDKWTEERVKNEIDLVMFERLQNEIIEFSGFKLDKTAINTAGTVGVPGEPNATSDVGSSQPEPKVS